MLVPAMASTGTWFCSSTLSTPMWAAPRAPPPDNTNPIRGRGACPEGGTCWAGEETQTPSQKTANSADFLALLGIGSVVRIVFRRDNRPPNHAHTFHPGG